MPRPGAWSGRITGEVTTPADPREREAAVTADIREEVARRLDAVEREEGVRVLYACESGSRAWGFASPDSDYDVRFVYAHRPDWYLSITDRRDVIERPIIGEFDRRMIGDDRSKVTMRLIRVDGRTKITAVMDLRRDRRDPG